MITKKRLFSTLSCFRTILFRDLERETAERFAASKGTIKVPETIEYMQVMNREMRNIEDGATITKCLKISHSCVDHVNQRVGKRLEESEVNLRRESQKYIDRFQRMMLSSKRSEWYALVYKQTMS